MRYIDWDAIEIEYAKGLRSNCSLAAEFNITEGAIRNRAKKFDWQKDLSARIKLKTDDIVRKVAYSSATSSATNITNSYQNTGNIVKVIEFEAEQRANYLLRERTALLNLEKILNDMTLELAEYPGNLERKEKIIKMHHDSLEKNINMLRRSYGISDNANGAADTPTKEVLVNMNPFEAYKKIIAIR